MPTITRTPRTWVVYAEPAEVGDALHEVRSNGGGPVRWFVTDPTDDDVTAAAQHGLRFERDLLQMVRPLPVDDAMPTISVRPFVPGTDESAWVAVNNRAFASHPEQGGWDVAQVVERESEPWFDAEGFLLHHDDETGELAGFVWTKVHGDLSPPVGEIYVIGVDPAFQGRGLGRTLTLVGLDWMHRERGIDHGMLYVDAANAPAVAMYTRLGFAVDHTDRSFAGEV